MDCKVCGKYLYDEKLKIEALYSCCGVMWYENFAFWTNDIDDNQHVFEFKYGTSELKYSVIRGESKIDFFPLLKIDLDFTKLSNLIERLEKLRAFM